MPKFKDLFYYCKYSIAHQESKISSVFAIFLFSSISSCRQKI